MEHRTKRYCVMSLNKGREQYVDSFDLLDQAKLCVNRMQLDYHFFLHDKRISFPDLVIRDTHECPSERPTGTTDRLRRMKRIDAENDRRKRERRKRQGRRPRVRSCCRNRRRRSGSAP